LSINISLTDLYRTADSISEVYQGLENRVLATMNNDNATGKSIRYEEDVKLYQTFQPSNYLIQHFNFSVDIPSDLPNPVAISEFFSSYTL
jgi:hypothetical protein